ncbi:hypothetical protein PoB_002555200 [Plakobranchus ocellatus]|uniref:Uncharacterized protein n=1 Tax=Plakobranchus ocellatus TaxID=259542 RepID=A0AAV3ZVD9_9GAST|nr:hypothetical protein PoB_002555200 [Plakobranchus ocellatus]
MAGLEPATEGSLQISGRTHKPLCYRRPIIDGAIGRLKPGIKVDSTASPISPVSSKAVFQKGQASETTLEDNQHKQTRVHRDNQHRRECRATETIKTNRRDYTGTINTNRVHGDNQHKQTRVHGDN